MGLAFGFVDVRITLNKRLDTAAAAMVHNMINRKRPRVFRPVSPLRKGSIDVDAIAKDQRDEWGALPTLQYCPRIELILPIAVKFNKAWQG